MMTKGKYNVVVVTSAGEYYGSVYATSLPEAFSFVERAFSRLGVDVTSSYNISVEHAPDHTFTLHDDLVVWADKALWLALGRGEEYDTLQEELSRLDR